MNQVVRLVGFETKTGSNNSGGWTLYLFKDGGGNKYQTFDDDLGTKAASLIGQPADITYEAQEKQLPAKGDMPARTVTNNILKSVKESTSVDSAGESSFIPLSSVTPNLEVVSKSEYETERQLRIMRQSALDRAISTVSAGVVSVTSPLELFALADTYVLYFEAGSGAFTQTPEEDLVRF